MRNSLIDINKLVLSYFIESLHKREDVYEYLCTRISDQCINKFKLGYAPRSGLLAFLIKNNIDLVQAELLGLIAHNEDGSLFDVFSNRIIIPIVHAGLLVGFGGRTYNDLSKVKYINSKTSVLYKKNEILFGLWYSRRYIVERGFAIVLEGYFDWLNLFDNGIRNGVAVCSTAFTDMHCTMLKRYTKEAGILFDGDAAGRKAAEKVGVLLKERGVHSFVIPLPKDTDPDEYLKEKGANILINSIHKIRKENNNVK